MEPKAKFPYEKAMYGRWLGVAESSTDVMASYILTATGKVVVRKSFWALSTDERNTPAIQERLVQLDAAIKSTVGDSITEEDVDTNLTGDLPVAPEGILDNDDEAIEPYDTGAIKSDADDYTPEAYD